MLFYSSAIAMNSDALENNSTSNADMILELNDRTANTSIETYPLFILDCYASWCEPCLAMNAVISGLSNELRGQVVFGTIDAEKNSDIKMKYNITAYPTLLFFKNGKLVKRHIGYWSKPTFVRMLKNFEPSLDLSRVNRTEQFQPVVLPESISLLMPGVDEPGLPMLINDSNLQFTLNKYPFFVLDGFDNECDFCREMNVTVLKLSADLKGRVAFGMINLARNNETMEKYNITAYPTLLVFKNGVLISIQIGYQSESEFMGVLRRLKPSLDVRQVNLNIRNYQRAASQGANSTQVTFGPGSETVAMFDHRGISNAAAIDHAWKNRY